ncbi:MAG: hypothetical protein H5T86_15885 [Armatimonadetes bacterium]|nr:hypothetical protein [Armatimonadota bacterium]
MSFAKGGAPFYHDIVHVVGWERDGERIKNFRDPASGKLRSCPQNLEYYFRPGIAWVKKMGWGAEESMTRPKAYALPPGMIPACGYHVVYVGRAGWTRSWRW